jgi:tetratricopeptide (TPR) repeat protein
LAQENPNNSEVVRNLAFCYKEIGELKRAREKFLSITKINSSKSEVVDAYIQAARCIAEDGDMISAVEMLIKLLSDSSFTESRAEIYEGMAKILKDNNKIDDFINYAEVALESNPLNTRLRFELAYAYSDKGNDKLALLHYKKLTDTVKHVSGLNNIGVSYGRLDLKAKSVKSYFKAADENETLAMSNLAFAYIDDGFIDDAQKLIDRAYGLHSERIEVNPRIGDAQQKIKNLLKTENEKEEKILSEAKKESQYRVKYSNARCFAVKISKEKIDGEWNTSRGVIKLAFDEPSGTFKASVQLEVLEQGYLDSLLSGKTSEKTIKTILLTINASIVNLSGKYTIKDSSKTSSTLLTGLGEKEIAGYVVINEQCDQMEIMEKSKEGNISYECWTKITPKSTN